MSAFYKVQLHLLDFAKLHRLRLVFDSMGMIHFVVDCIMKSYQQTYQDGDQNGFAETQA